MLTKIFRFLTLMSVALSMAMAFCHLLQLPPRMSFDAELWRNTQTMYQNFGPPIGALIEGAAVAFSVLLTIMVLRRRPAFQWTLLGALCMVASMGAWWFFINPVNQAMVNWTAATMPADWQWFRAQWEYTHAVRAVLQIVGFSSLLISTLVETPSEIVRTVTDRTALHKAVQTLPHRDVEVIN